MSYNYFLLHRHFNLINIYFKKTRHGPLTFLQWAICCRIVLRLHSADSPYWREAEEHWEWDINLPFWGEFVALQSMSDLAFWTKFLGLKRFFLLICLKHVRSHATCTWKVINKTRSWKIRSWSLWNVDARIGTFLKTLHLEVSHLTSLFLIFIVDSGRL